jgi:phage terminase large subunit-like protein
MEIASRIVLVGQTEHDEREVMIEGVSGLLAVHGWHERPTWLLSRKRLEWSNGAVAQVFSAEDPESLRGPQFCCASLALQSRSGPRIRML